MTILLFAILVMLILLLVWSTEATVRLQNIVLRAAHAAPLHSKRLMLVAVVGFLGFWWLASGR